MFFVQVTSLHLAAQFSSASVVEALLTAGADVKAVDSEQCSALYLAVKHNEDADVIKVLVAGGADVKAVDTNEQTFLHVAAKESKGAGSFHIHRKTMKELGTLAVLGVREQPNLAQNLVTHRH